MDGLPDFSKMTPTEFQEWRTSEAGKIALATAATKAANGGTPAPTTEKALPIGGITAKNSGPLKKCFERAAVSGISDLEEFGSNKAMDDPRGYLHAREGDNPQGRYVVSKQKMGLLLDFLMASGRGNPEYSVEAAKHWGVQGLQQATVKFEQMANIPGFFDAKGHQFIQAINKAALDTTTGGGTSGGPLIRVDIDPVLREAYLRLFPALGKVKSVPANGLVHTWNVRSATGTAAFISELGALSATDGNSTYTQTQNSNIAVIAARRGISLKLQYAVQQSGMGQAFKLAGSDNLEIMGALTSIAKLDQAAFFQYTVASANSASTKDLETGIYNANSYDGLRFLLQPSTSSLTMGSSDTYLGIIDQGVEEIFNAGGDIDDLVIFLSTGVRRKVNLELVSFYRTVNGTPGAEGFPYDQVRNGLMTIADVPSKFVTIPASAQTDGIGYYTLSSVVKEDVYIIDPQGVGIAYLGSPTPQILELPIGYDSTLSNVYIAFCMHGAMIDIPSFQRKVRVNQVTT